MAQRHSLEQILLEQETVIAWKRICETTSPTLAPLFAHLSAVGRPVPLEECEELEDGDLRIFVKAEGYFEMSMIVKRGKWRFRPEIAN